jgi:hypothetical protein
LAVGHQLEHVLGFQAGVQQLLRTGACGSSPAAGASGNGAEQDGAGIE